ncbi:MAG: glycosyltransferase family 2 protein [Streptosporangiaceae bacterium]|nr:glycosyltransferase family 2 protein [Streptosporangiaceae bacterium]
MTAVTVVIATRNRETELRRTLGRLAELPEKPAVIVIDNASTDGTRAAARDACPAAELITLPENRGAWARNVGVARAATEYVAFSDDDSWWEPGSLRLACELLAAHPELGLIAGRTLVGSAGTDDPLNAVLAASPLPRDGLPGPRVLGFLGCAAVARRAAFLTAGGYSELMGVGGEEELFAMDLATAGWAAAYVSDVVARHWPSPARDVAARRGAEERNRVLIAWLRRPARDALAGTAALAGRAPRDPIARRALAGLLARLPRALAARRPLPPRVAAQLQRLEQANG